MYKVITLTLARVHKLFLVLRRMLLKVTCLLWLSSEFTLQTLMQQDSKPGFGSRFLTNEQDVWTQNAWDHVKPPPSHSTQIKQSLDRQKASPLPADEKGKVNDKPAKHWDNFYKTNSRHFFRDRKWLCQEFGELSLALKPDSGEVTIVDLGCGAGNTLFPLLQTNQNLRLTYRAYDYSSHGIKLIQTNPLYASFKCASVSASVWDLTSPCLPPDLLPNSADILLLVFVLSALNPSEWNRALTNIRRVLKKGGKVCIRDYGRHDLVQLRFKENRWLDENFYCRGDKTRVYFFDLDDLSILFTGAPAPADSYILKSSADEQEEEDADETGLSAEAHMPTSTTSTPSDDKSDSSESDAHGQNSQPQVDVQSIPESTPTLPPTSPPPHPPFKSIQLGTDRRLLINRKRKLKMYRVWVQGIFEKL